MPAPSLPPSLPPASPGWSSVRVGCPQKRRAASCKVSCRDLRLLRGRILLSCRLPLAAPSDPSK